MSSIDRRPHALRAEKTVAIPRHVIFFDTETNMTEDDEGRTQHTLRLGWACYVRRSASDRREKTEWLKFTKSSQLWRFILDRCQTKNKLWVIALNLSFDFTVVGGFKHLRKEGFKCKFFYSASAATLIKVTRRGSSIMFVDFFNWFRESLATIGERIGIEKLSVDFDTVDDSELSTYCRRDVEILVGMFAHLTGFLTTNMVSRLCYTIGSTAMAAFLFRHYREKIYIHNNKEAIDLERESYKGGRTECFFIGHLTNGPFYVLDINSLYPFIMQGNQFPVKYEHIRHDLSVSELSRVLVDRSAVADVTIDTQTPIYAVKRDRTIFPVGEFRTVLTTPELLYAIENNDIKTVHTAVSYFHANIFTTYVNRFYKLRLECKADDNLLFEHFCKLLLNSLYGKFGQKIEVWEKIGDAPNEPDRIEDIIDAVTHRRRRLRYLLGEVSEVKGVAESRHSFPAISSHVTAYARLYMYKLMLVAGHRNYFYCDTDSLFVNGDGLKNLSSFLHDTDLGKLKVETTTDAIHLFGLKDYMIDGKTTIKGISKTAIKISDVDYKQEQWPSLQGLLVKGQIESYSTHMQEKHLSREYTKGDVAVSGWVSPFVLRDSDEHSVLPF